MKLPALTTDQMREVDRIMIEELGVQLIQMMENAGRSLARVAMSRYQPESATVLAGTGGNGGGGLAAARHLSNRGVEVTVCLSRSIDDLTPVARQQAEVLQRMWTPIQEEPTRADLIIDALIGYSLQGDPRGRVAGLIDWANSEPTAVLSLDTPSGLDTTTGAVGSPCIRADATVTLALPKTGLHEAQDHVGSLFVADISVPPAVYEVFGFQLDDLFGSGGVIEVDPT